MKHRVKGRLLWLLLAMVIALGILFYQSLSWHYEMRARSQTCPGFRSRAAAMRWYMRAAVRGKASP